MSTTRKQRRSDHLWRAVTSAMACACAHLGARADRLVVRERKVRRVCHELDVQDQLGSAPAREEQHPLNTFLASTAWVRVSCGRVSPITFSQSVLQSMCRSRL
eukprot:3264358-Prymnesium_polylepis.1